MLVEQFRFRVSIFHLFYGFRNDLVAEILVCHGIVQFSISHKIILWYGFNNIKNDLIIINPLSVGQ